MRRILHSMILLIFFSSLVFCAERKVFIFYYVWYGNPDFDGNWYHWQDYNHFPPLDIASSFYPKLGPYSSTDRKVLYRHMKWIASTGAQILIYSWWGKGDFTDGLIPRVLDAAAAYSLKVAFLIEPYSGRTGKTICDDIEYLITLYGQHPAFFRMADKTAYGPFPGRRPVFFIYNPQESPVELRRMSDRIHGSRFDSILLLQSTDLKLVEKTRVDGLFAYEAYQNLYHFYPSLLESAKKRRSIFVPCVSPGFNMNRTLGSRQPVFRSRRSGDTYDRWWEQVIASESRYVSIISFNEWHEGTQIEPAVQTNFPLFRYLSYEGAYGKTGISAENAYLQRTARWIKIFFSAGANK